MPSVIQWNDHGKQTTLDAEVIVVGTGAGGAACAAELAEGGARVVLIEEGSLIRTEDFLPHPSAMMKRTYREMASTVIMGPPHIAYAEGRCVGGSTTINGGMSFRTPEHILDQWAKEYQLPTLSPDQMAPWFARVERRTGVSLQLPETIGEDSRLMRAGANAMGYRWTPNTRSQIACVGTNNCGFGCPTGAKQSTLVSYVPRALQAGATLITDCRVKDILTQGTKVCGVRGAVIDPRTRRPSGEVTVRAERVVLACGAVHTPLLLLRNRIANASREVGKNFLCHPNAKVTGLFPHEVQGWKGVSQGQQVRHFQEDGIVIAENFVPPGLLAVASPSVGDRTFEAMKRYNQTVTAACLLEDTVTGRVRRGPWGSPWIRYRFSQQDTERAVRGVSYLARMLFAAGASEVHVPFPMLPALRSEADITAFENSSFRPRDLELFTVHLMGTAAMGRLASKSVVDEWGHSHDVDGLYIADASVFPSAIGVNPQVTIMALASRTAHHILEEIHG